MSCVKDYFKTVAGFVLEANPGVQNLGQEVLRNIKRGDDKTTIGIVEPELLDMLGGGVNNPSGNQGYQGEIVSVSISDSGNLDLGIKDDKGNVRDYFDVSIRTGKALGGQRVQLAVGLESKIMPLRDSATPSGYSDITKPISEKSAMLNKYISDVLIGGYEQSESALAPYVKEWHRKARAKSSLYRETVNLVKGGFGNPELWDKIKANVFITGDIDEVMLSEAVTIADTSARRTYELLDTELPKLDRKIKQLVKNSDTRKQLDVIFGTSGFGNLRAMPEIVQAMYDGASLEELKAMVKATDKEIEDARILKDYMVNRVVKNNVQNSGGNNRVAVMAALLALEEKDHRGVSAFETMKWLREKQPQLFVDLEKLSATVGTLNDVVNLGKQDSSFGAGAGMSYKGWDGHNTLDVMDTTLEYKIVNADEVRKYIKDGSPWKVIRKPGEEFGIIARESTRSFMDGIGVNTNRIRNGIGISADMVPHNENGEPDAEWMDANNIVRDFDNGYERFRVILRKDEFDTAGGKRNIAHRLMRTYTHNKELIETQSVRELIVDKMTYKGQEGRLKLLNDALKANNKRKARERDPILPFINTDVKWFHDAKKPDEISIEKNFPEVFKKFEPVEHISNYGNFNREIKYVRRDMKDMLTGHTQSLIASDDWPQFQKWEMFYKQIVKMMKIKMVVVNPAKLASDYASNIGILMTMDVSIADTWKYSKEASKYSSEMSKLEGALVSAKFDLGLAEVDGKGIEAAKAKVAKAEKAIEDHPYYEALKAGFIQSMGTSMLIKEFDTVSGLQHTIETLANKLLEDNNKNKTQIHRALATFMDAGFSVNDALDYLGTMKKINGTSFGDELLEISDRLKSKKARLKWHEEQLGRKLTDAEKKQFLDESDVVGWISEWIAAPNSEAVRQGSRAMQMADAMSRWTLYNHRVDRALEAKGIVLPDGSSVAVRKAVEKAISDGKLTKEEWVEIQNDAAVEALRTFVDYRLNLPSEIKFLSDYGFLMFPSFWMRIQKVIWNLAKYHPLNAGGGLLIADLLGNSSANVMTASMLNKGWNGSLVYPGGQTHNLLDPDTYFLFKFTSG